MTPDGIIFDLDGTLWDPSEATVKSWERSLARQPDRPESPSKEAWKSVIGMAPDPLMEALFPQLSLERRRELFHICCMDELIYFREHGGILFPKVKETLAVLKKRAPLFIVSNCNNGYIEAFLSAHGMYEYFFDWECIGRTGREKSENIKLIVEAHLLKAPVYIGDTIMDKDAADKAGVPFVFAAYGFGDVPGARSVTEFSQLPEVLFGSEDT